MKLEFYNTCAVVSYVHTCNQ